MIIPTVGRVLWYYPFPSDPGPNPKDQPLAAIVAHVWSSSCVNLMVIDANGATYNRTSVLLVQEGASRPDLGFCEWMPYQKGQAAKNEVLETQLKYATGG
jgi:hypothetical protein